MNRVTRKLVIAIATFAFSACAHKAEPKPEVKMIPPPNAELSPPPPPKFESVALPAPSHPNVALRIAFRAGAVDDPRGKEGVTALAAEVMAEGGTEKLSAAELLRALYPMAAHLAASTDAEMTVFEGEVHKDQFAKFLPIFLDVITHPRWDPKEFERLREDAINDIEKRLRTSDDENLGKAGLRSHLFISHPYGHYDGGTVQSLRALTLEDVKAQAAKVFTRSRLIIGVAGAYPDCTQAEIEKALASLPVGDHVSAKVPAVPPQVQPKVLIIEKETESTAVSMGYPWMLHRGDPDYPAMRVALSAFGEHRQFIGRLMDRLRSLRGLNYGDYAYVEHFEQDADTTYPEPNIPLTFQMFSIWLRPVEEKNGVFALRAALSETRKLAEAGLTDEEISRAKNFLTGYLRLYTQTDSRRLGFAIDDRFYGTPNYQDQLITAIGKLTPAEVNQAIKKWIKPDDLKIVIVTRDGAALKKALVSGAPSPIHYDTPVARSVLEEDKHIEALPLGLKDEDVQVVKATDLFEK